MCPWQLQRSFLLAIDIAGDRVDWHDCWTTWTSASWEWPRRKWNWIYREKSFDSNKHDKREKAKHGTLCSSRDPLFLLLTINVTDLWFQVDMPVRSLLDLCDILTNRNHPSYSSFGAFRRIFDCWEFQSHCKVPPTFQDKVASWFSGGSDEPDAGAVGRAESQRMGMKFRRISGWWVRAPRWALLSLSPHTFTT